MAHKNPNVIALGVDVSYQTPTENRLLLQWLAHVEHNHADWGMAGSWWEFAMSEWRIFLAGRYDSLHDSSFFLYEQRELVHKTRLE